MAKAAFSGYHAVAMKSYTSLGGSLLSQLREFRDLARGARRADPAAGVGQFLDMCSTAERAYCELTGHGLTGAKAMEIGPGTAMSQMYYFAQKCDVIGVDLDVLAPGFNPLDYLRMLRVNGPKRVVKTIGRKFFAHDRAFREALRKKLRVAKLRRPRVAQMDAARMDLPDASFDIIYSFKVFEHLPDPRAVLQEMVRVLKPGGVAYIYAHLFTCDSGFHDLRIISGQREQIPYWAHLRPQHQEKVKASSYLNQWRLSQWKQLFGQELPGASIRHIWDDSLRNELRLLRSAGELSSYSDEELLTHFWIAAWKKP